MQNGKVTVKGSEKEKDEREANGETDYERMGEQKKNIECQRPQASGMCLEWRVKREQCSLWTSVFPFRGQAKKGGVQQLELF